MMVKRDQSASTAGTMADYGEEASPTCDLTAELSVHLAEIQVVFAQMHTRMRGVYTVLSMSIVLFAAIAGFLLYQGPVLAQRGMAWAALLIPLPFYVLLSVQIREHILMFRHDAYFNRVAARIREIVPAPGPLLGFLEDMRETKWGAAEYSVLSMMLYGIHALSIAGAFLVYLSTPKVIELIPDVVLLGTNLVLGSVIFVVLGRIAWDHWRAAGPRVPAAE
jgi:hypothetical protein